MLLFNNGSTLFGGGMAAGSPGRESGRCEQLCRSRR